MGAPQAPDAFAKRVGLTFADEGLLVRALTHPSWSAEHGGTHYQRLEFLGDAVLGFLVAEHLHRTFPGRPEGDLTRMRTSVVRGGALADAAGRLGVPDAVRLGRGSQRSGDRLRPSVLEAVFEALVGAVYLDGGVDAARAFVHSALAKRLETQALLRGLSDSKTELQEVSQARGMGLPEYHVVAQSGLAHARTFQVEVEFGGRVAGHGTGTSKQAAEQAAAAEALHRFR